jgi:hypothetical protein
MIHAYTINHNSHLASTSTITSKIKKSIANLRRISQAQNLHDAGVAEYFIDTFLGGVTDEGCVRQCEQTRVGAGVVPKRRKSDHAIPKHMILLP